VGCDLIAPVAIAIVAAANILGVAAKGKGGGGRKVVKTIEGQIRGRCSNAGSYRLLRFFFVCGCGARARLLPNCAAPACLKASPEPLPASPSDLASSICRKFASSSSDEMMMGAADMEMRLQGDAWPTDESRRADATLVLTTSTDEAGQDKYWCSVQLLQQRRRWRQQQQQQAAAASSSSKQQQQAAAASSSKQQQQQQECARARSEIDINP